MARFEELNRNANIVLNELISNSNICKLLNYTSRTPLDKDELENPAALLYKNIYPFRYIPSTEDEIKCYLTFTFNDIRKGDNVYFKASNVTFYIICHRDMQIIDEGLRVYRIMEELDKTFNMSEDIAGMGKLYFDSADEVVLNNKFLGYYVSYNFTNLS